MGATPEAANAARALLLDTAKQLDTQISRIENRSVAVRDGLQRLSTNLKTAAADPARSAADLLQVLDDTVAGTAGTGGTGGTRIPVAPTGQVGGCLDFSGSGDSTGSYVSIPSTFDIASLPFTIEAWVNPDDYSDYGAIFGKRDSAAAGDMRVDLGLNLTSGAVYTYDGTAQRISTFSPTVGTWTHLVFVARSTGSDVYLNGAFKETITAVTLGTDATAAVSIGITQNGGDDSYDGRIDELRISNSQRAAWLDSHRVQQPGHAYHVLCSGGSHILTS